MIRPTCSAPPSTAGACPRSACASLPLFVIAQPFAPTTFPLHRHRHRLGADVRLLLGQRRPAASTRAALQFVLIAVSLGGFARNRWAPVRAGFSALHLHRRAGPACWMCRLVIPDDVVCADVRGLCDPGNLIVWQSAVDGALRPGPCRHALSFLAAAIVTVRPRVAPLLSTPQGVDCGGSDRWRPAWRNRAGFLAGAFVAFDRLRLAAGRQPPCKPVRPFCGATRWCRWPSTRVHGVPHVLWATR